jgi:hypothetical protein
MEQAVPAKTWKQLPPWVKSLRSYWNTNFGPKAKDNPEIYEWGWFGIDDEGWYTFDGNEEATSVLGEWIEHVRCPDEDCMGSMVPAEEWGELQCDTCGTKVVPEWSTPWGPPTPVEPANWVKGPCPICAKLNRRKNPSGPYAFLCTPPATRSVMEAYDDENPMGMHFYITPSDVPGESVSIRTVTADMELITARQDAIQEENRKIREGCCYDVFGEQSQLGWYRYIPVWFNYCHACGVLFAARTQDQDYCSRECGPRPKNYAVQLRSYAINAATAINRADIFGRDSYVCYLCGKPTDPDAKSSLDRPSIDHIHPIILGGHHTKDNVRTAHLRCNLNKSDKLLTPEQLKALKKYLGTNPEESVDKLD